MGRRSHHWHGMKHMHIANQREGWTESDYARVSTWCSDVDYMSAKDRARPLHEVDCPKCAAAIGRHMLAKRYAGRVELRRPEGYDSEGEGNPWRSRYGKVWKGAYEFWLDGVHRGYILCDNGWGKPWELRALNAYADSAEKPWGYVQSSTPRKWASAPDSPPMFGRVHSAAKEAMACAAVKAAEAGMLPTVAEFAVQRERAKERQAQEERERETARQEREAFRLKRDQEERERREIAGLALNDLETRIDLTNTERAGIAAIRLMLGLSTESTNEQG